MPSVLLSFLIFPAIFKMIQPKFVYRFVKNDTIFKVFLHFYIQLYYFRGISAFFYDHWVIINFKLTNKTIIFFPILKATSLASASCTIIKNAMFKDESEIQGSIKKNLTIKYSNLLTIIYKLGMLQIDFPIYTRVFLLFLLLFGYQFFLVKSFCQRWFTSS